MPSTNLFKNTKKSSKTHKKRTLKKLKKMYFNKRSFKIIQRETKYWIKTSTIKIQKRKNEHSFWWQNYET